MKTRLRSAAALLGLVALSVVLVVTAMALSLHVLKLGGTP